MSEFNEALKVEDEALEEVAGGAAMQKFYFCEKCHCEVAPEHIETFYLEKYHKGCGGEISVISGRKGRL